MPWRWISQYLPMLVRDNPSRAARIRRYAENRVCLICLASSPMMVKTSRIISEMLSQCKCLRILSRSVKNTPACVFIWFQAGLTGYLPVSTGISLTIFYRFGAMLSMLQQLHFRCKLLKYRQSNSNPDKPFIWASGWYSPIYCDNRMTSPIPISERILQDGYRKSEPHILQIRP